jgi:hypothetical protein
MWIGPPPFATLTARFQFDLDWILLGLGLLALILLGALVIVKFKRWQAEQKDTVASPRIEDYRVLMDDGVLDPVEFERIREHLEKKVNPDSSPPSAENSQPGRDGK